jgi:7-keto-8-aminopelargonate synthetase-like enzyme
MEGTFEPIGALAQLCQQHHGTCLFLDEAHSAGTFGHASLALASPQLQNIEPWLIGVMLGCGKSLSSAGGLLLMPQSLCDLGVQGARSYVYSTAPSPSQMAAVLASLVQLRSEGQVLASRLQTHLLDFHSSLKTIVGSSLSTVVSTTDWDQPAVNKVCSPDFDHGPAHNNGPRLEVGLSVLTQGTAHQHLFSPIVTIMIKDHKDAFQSLVLAHQRLEQAGFLTSLVRTPTVPAGQERIRITFSVQKQDGWAARLAWALSDLARQL